MTPDDVRVTRLLFAHRKSVGWTLESHPEDPEQDWASPDAVGQGWNVVIGIHPWHRWTLSVSFHARDLVVLTDPPTAQVVADLLAAVGLVPAELTSGWAAGRMAMAAELSDALLALRDRFHDKERETGRPDYKGRAGGFETAAALARMAGGDVW